ncbi:uncharacterized protein PHALS_00129 [Plasmopara halstedii]|uniref:Uncharacterized protein n=1 Tax=Plasmopara halstedii TaxID=4781 RepID=A0A0P1A6K2_PLAHL|nr:uncharacterized protein PHALS_00129 [Plasmopara halstedii]CEG35798.1 hypothetical protein PHALS_00129 [Plasmopara halstedii]|eukprot:XP_024572167.1 hypothetical protein PHALS_00129 [Plasmopara halstedii]
MTMSIDFLQEGDRKKTCLDLSELSFLLLEVRIELKLVARRFLPIERARLIWAYFLTPKLLTQVNEWGGVGRFVRTRLNLPKWINCFEVSSWVQPQYPTD